MSREHRLLLVLLGVAVCKLAVASLNVEQAGLSIVYPREKRKSIEVAMADFGVPKYGGFLRGELVYVSSRQSFYNNQTYYCSPRDCEYGCDLNSSAPRIQIQKQPGTAYIMLVERGPRDLPAPRDACYFLDKVYNAQLVGADAVLVANYAGENLTTLVTPETSDTAAERRGLTVSAGMISRADADYLKDALAAYGSVTLLLNWTKSMPQSTQVSWEFWTGSEDVCGSMCEERTNFTAAIKDQAMNFEQLAITKFTPRYFLYACKNGTTEEDECVNNCFSHGRYCGWPNTNNYTGKDVLRMNLRAKCFFKQAAANGRSYLWWEYATRFAANCSIATKQYNADCANKVFDSLAASYTVGTRAEWEACSNAAGTEATIPLLEEELLAQYGNYTNKTVAEVKINPTIRINGEQYRGSLESGPVLRALCAAFPSGHEPGVCNSPLISDDECAAPNGEGYVRCKVAESGNRTRCINTFQGFQCACGNGFQLVFEPGDAFSELCDDVNECLVSKAPLRNPDCSCSRCACVNTLGSYNCTGELKNQCTKEFNYGGCWNEVIDGQTYHNCVDDIAGYQLRASRGALKEGEKWSKCGDCPRCFRLVGDRCEKLCDLSQCDPFSGYCRGSTKDDTGKAAGGGGGGKSSSSGGGVNPGFMVLVALGAAALAGAVVMAANHIVMKRRMGEEIREIMGAYMPLQEDRARDVAAAAAAARGGGRGGFQERIIRPDEDSDEDGAVGPYGWSTGRTAAAAAAPAAPAPGGSAATAAAAPTLVGASQRAVWGPPATAPAAAAAGGGPTFGSPIPLSAVPTAAAPRPTVEATAAADADPLLGRTLTSSSSLGAPAGNSAKKASADGDDNPFL